MTDTARKTLLGLAGALLFAAVATPAAAQNAMSLLPQDQPVNRPTGLWTIFQPIAPTPEPKTEPAEPEAEAEEPVAPQTKYRLVKVPLPPVIDRRGVRTDPKLAARTPVKADGAQTAPAATDAPKVADIAPAAPPQPRPTGVFAMLAAYSQPEGVDTAAPSSGDIVRPPLTPPATTRVAPAQTAPPTTARLTKLDLSDPFKPRKIPSTPGEKDDDLEDEEGETKLVEKQVDSVQIACLKPELLALIYKAGDHFGATPVITSGFRSHGRRGSHHRKCEAADFFVPDVSSAKLVSFLKSLPGAGGVGTYCHTKSVHIDTGEPRNWHQCGRRRSFALRTPVTEIGSR